MPKRRRTKQALDEPQLNRLLIATTDADDLLPQWDPTRDEVYFTRRGDGAALTLEEAGAVMERCEKERRKRKALEDEGRRRGVSRGDRAWAEADAVRKRAIPVDMQALGIALDWHDEMGASWHLDLETGESLVCGRDFDDDEIGEAMETDPDRFLLIEPLESRRGFRDMEDFAHTVRDRTLTGKLEVALNGRGAFGRFKDVLRDYPKERERWFEFKHRRLDEAAREWLAAHDIEPVPRRKDDDASEGGRGTGPSRADCRPGTSDVPPRET